MSRISVDVSSARIPVLQVGYQGENEVTDVLFDISSWITEFGEGVAQLRVKRPGNSEDESYVLSLIITDGKAVWTVSETDTANKGNGKVQLSYLVGNIVKKAVIYPYKVGKSIVGADNPVDPFDSWIERSKAWAIGKTLDGNAVPETDETYQNNAKYYAEQADILGSAQVVLATEKATLATEKATLATAKANAAAASETNAAASEAAVNGVSTQLTNRMTAIETEQSVQSARMDTFTSLPEGSTSGNAELADIRVGANGTTYDTAGNAVRGQIGELKSDLINEVSERNNAISNAVNNEVSERNNAISNAVNNEVSERNNAISNAVNNEKQRAISEEQRIESLFTLPTQEAVNKWLDEHPEATTTVQDGSLSDVKFSASGLLTHIPVVATVTELQTAITDGRKTIALLTGATFNVNSKIELGNDVTLFGCGAEFVRATGFEGIMIECGTGCKLQDFSMDGNRAAMIAPTWDKTIEIATKSNCVVNNIKIDNGNEAIVAYGDDVEIRNCKITNCGGNGIHFSGGNRTRVENCTVINTNLKSGMGHEDGCIIWSDQCNETTCIGNYVENGLYGFGAIDADHNSRIIIANNIMKNMRKGAFEGIFQTSIPDKIMILDNMIINCKALSINRTDANKAVDNSFVISGNLITSTFLALRRINNIQCTNNILIGTGVEVVSCNFAKITNNKIIGKSEGNKIDVYSSVGCEISNNTIHNYSITGYGIKIESDATHCFISNNVIVQMPYIGSAGTPVAILTGNGSIVCNNVIYGYSGVGIFVANGSLVQSNAIYGKDSSFIPIRVFGGVSGVIISYNSYIGTNSIATPSNSIVQDNLENTHSPWIPLTANFTNVTGNQFGSILKCDTYSFAITADEGYTLPSEIAVTGAESYEYNPTTGVITIYQPTSAVTVTANGVAN